jgi:hypothetical protein
MIKQFGQDWLFAGGVGGDIVRPAKGGKDDDDSQCSRQTSCGEVADGRGGARVAVDHVGSLGWRTLGRNTLGRLRFVARIA